MSASNNRVRDYETVHHLTSRIAHRVFFLGEDERNDLVEFVRRSAAFSGIRLLGWCILANHFHLLVYLPTPALLDEDELLRRYGTLKGRRAADAAAGQLAKWRQSRDTKSVDRWLDGLRRRMYDIGEFMKLVKQWFTEEYNRRRSHCGTLWESVYHDRPVPMRVRDMSRVLGYIHLNPMRAAAASSYDGYAWSSFAALKKGDGMALAGLRFVYDSPDAGMADLAAQHEILMDELLEEEKRKRAEEIARRRAQGYEVPSDSLTTEAMVAQAAAHHEKIRIALDELNAQRSANRKPHRSCEAADREVLMAIEANPSASVEMLASQLSLAPSSVYERLRSLKGKGLISRPARTSPWQFHTIKQV